MRDNRQYYEEIKRYYRQSNWLYKHIWYAGKSLGLHFGFADGVTKNHTEALINQYKYVIDKGEIKRGMRVLDAGCGVGGAAIYIAQKTGAEVVGITLVEEQAAEANGNAGAANVSKLTKFVVGDYTKTGFEPNSFDLVFGIESVCYAEPKASFLKEAWRVLKPGGKLVVTDGYRRRGVNGQIDRQILRDFCEGWRLADLVSYQEMKRVIGEGGFINVEVEDKTHYISMSANKMRRLVKWWDLGEILFGWLDLPIVEMARENAKGMRYWLKGLDMGLFGYFAHTAIKT